MTGEHYDSFLFTFVVFIYGFLLWVSFRKRRSHLWVSFVADGLQQVDQKGSAVYDE